jgi:hypothetical protein
MDTEKKKDLRIFFVFSSLFSDLRSIYKRSRHSGLLGPVLKTGQSKKKFCDILRELKTRKKRPVTVSEGT